MMSVEHGDASNVGGTGFRCELPLERGTAGNGRGNAGDPGRRTFKSGEGV